MADAFVAGACTSVKEPSFHNRLFVICKAGMTPVREKCAGLQLRMGKLISGVLSTWC